MTSKRQTTAKITILVLAIIAISVALTWSGRDTKLNYEIGRPWTNPTLTAPFEIPIELDEAAKQHIRDSIMANFIETYRIDSMVAKEQTRRLATVLATHKEVPSAIRSQLLATIDTIYRNGIVDNSTSDKITQNAGHRARILGTNGVAQLIDAGQMRSIRGAYALLDSAFKPTAHDLIVSLPISDYLTPNVTLDHDINSKSLAEDTTRELAPRGTVQSGEAIIFTGTIVTPQTDAILKTYSRMLAQRTLNDKIDKNLSFAGKATIVAMLMTAFFLFLYFMRNDEFNKMRSVVFLISFLCVFICTVILITKFRSNYLYLIPFAALPIVISAFFDSRISLFAHLVCILTCSLVANEQAQFIIMQFIAGDIAIVSLQQLRRRSQLVQCALFIFVGYTLTYVAQTLISTDNLDQINWHYLVYFAINCIILSFAYIGIFVVEKLFGFTSIVTLVELSDINNNILRKLSVNCPGTFQHSLQVSNLASEAAMEIGANMQLARAGALYHDIGKLSNPTFFTENQNGINPHDGLTPDQSASIVTAHVKDGLKLAEKARLPQVIKDLILQHHGKGVTRYFYAQACKNSPFEKVDRAPFSYPGPNPQTKEAAILMMADACEAALKSVSDHSESAIAGMVDRVINGQIADGMFREAPISFKDVETVKHVFIEQMKTFYHTSISYPDEVRPAEQDSEPETGADD
ncbi:MAG: HDIG domain-containing protein [Bacteroidales bacterium]|nr:HDIG domain-containing protein [Candidatus Sodaliphilus aphodohippi]